MKFPRTFPPSTISNIGQTQFPSPGGLQLQPGGLIDLLKGRDPRGPNAVGGLFDLIDRHAPVGIDPSKLGDFTAADAPRGHQNQEEAFAGLGECLAYYVVVRYNDRLTNAEKAVQAHDWAFNFEVKGIGHCQMMALRDAEKFERLAEEDRQREQEEELERQRKQERDQELIDATEREQSPGHIPGGAPPA